MARIWQEGFEDGLPFKEYLPEDSTTSQHISGTSIVQFPSYVKLVAGRSLSGTGVMLVSYSNVLITRVINPVTNELYFRVYYKNTNTLEANAEIIRLTTAGNVKIISISKPDTTTSHDIKVLKSGSYATRHTVVMSQGVWYKIDIYIKVSDTVGAYEVKIDDVSVKSESGINTGTTGISNIVLGAASGSGNCRLYFDDIALNNTSGAVNNSWCGGGTIISLKPKGAGNKSQWDTCAGYAKGESGTTTTNVKITGHGLATNDVIYNKTRNEYRIITYVDADNFTVTTVTGQTTSDIILLYKYVSTIAATATTSNLLVTLVGHTLTAGDVFVNTTRSNAIRKVLSKSSNTLYHYISGEGDTVGTAVTSQAAGDSIKTFAFLPYAITNHWEAVANQSDPSPKYSYIKSSTSGDIDTFDMEELVADKGLPSGTTIVAISHNTYAQEAGAGSQIQPVFRISGTEYEGSVISLSGGTLQYQQIYDTSPATSSAWSRSEVDGLEAGVKLV